MTWSNRLRAAGFWAFLIGIVALLSFAVYIGDRLRVDAWPQEPDILKAMSPPDTTAVAEFRDRMSNSRWIDQPLREMTDLLGPGHESFYSCDGSKGFVWLLNRRSFEARRDPAKTHVVEVLRVSADGFGLMDTGESKITAVRTQEYRYRN